MGLSIDCLKVFGEAPEDKTRADVIDARAPDRACQFEKVSAYNSDPVQDCEFLIRLVVDDTHISRTDEGVRLKSSFMSDSLSFGSSSLRLGRASINEVKITIDQLLSSSSKKADGTEREVIGYVLISAKLARSTLVTYEVKDEDGKSRLISGNAFGAYATGLDQRPNHADIFCVATLDKKALTRSARNRAASKLTEAISSSFNLTSSITEVLKLGLPNSSAAGSNSTTIA